MAQNRLQIDIDATWKGAGATSKAEKDIKKVSKSAEESTGSFKKLEGGLSLLGATFGAVAGAGAVFAKALDFAEMGSNVTATRDTFDALSKSIGATADELLGSMSEATKGTVSDLELMQSANKFVSMGLAESAEEAGKLANVAVTLGTAMGEEAGASMENFALLLANQSIPRLDSFGISSGKVRERIAELTTGVNAMDRETAFMTATMEEADKTLVKIGETSANTFTRLRVEAENAKNAVMVLVSDGLEPLAKVLLNDYGKAVEGTIAEQIEMAKSSEELIELSKRISEQQKGLGDTFTGTSKELKEAQGDIRGQLALTSLSLDDFKNSIGEAFGENEVVASNLEGAFDALEAEFNAVTGRAMDFQVATDRIELFDLKQQVNSLSIGLDGLGKSAEGATFPTQQLIKAFGESAGVIQGLLDAEELAEDAGNKWTKTADGWRKNSDIAKDAIVEANNAIIDSYREVAFEALLAQIDPQNAEQLRETLQFGVDIGLMTQQQAEMRAQFTLTSSALQALGASADFASLGQLDRKEAFDALTSGLATTTEGAIAYAQSVVTWLIPALDGSAEAGRKLKEQLDAIPTDITTNVRINQIGDMPQFRDTATGQRVGAFAHGGAFSAGRPMLVGENGAELLMPSTSGTIVPNNQINNNMSPTINITVAGGMGGSPQAIAQTVARELGEMIRR